MKFIVIFLLVTLAACSGDVEDQKAPKNKSMPVKTEPVMPLKSQPKKAEARISGVGQTRISGASSSVHVSGQ